MQRIASILAALFAVLLIGSSARAEDKAASGQKQEKKASTKTAAKKTEHAAWNEGDIKWTDAPPVLPAGAKMAVLQGDPGKAGMYTIRLKTPDGYRVAAHWHPMDEHLTVLSGEFHVAVGDAFDATKGDALKPGGFASMPAKMHHYAWTKGETVVQVSGMGPFKLVYVNPADDPSKKGPEKPSADKKKS